MRPHRLKSLQTPICARGSKGGHEADRRSPVASCLAVCPSPIAANEESPAAPAPTRRDVCLRRRLLAERLGNEKDDERDG
jgi:hypothetical protein